METGKNAYVPFLDVKRACDMVWHISLMVNLHTEKEQGKHLVPNSKFVFMLILKSALAYTVFCTILHHAGWEAMCGSSASPLQHILDEELE